MPSISLRYGRSQIPFSFSAERFRVLGENPPETPLTDAQIGARFDAPVGSETLENIIKTGETVLIVVPDATRRTACDSMVNLLVRRLIANGTMPYQIKIIFATGIHRAVTADEKRELLTPFIFQRIKTLDHAARDLMQTAGLGSSRFVNLGEINSSPIELNRALVEHDHVIIIGGVSFHYFAGFTGGRKLICPGLASARTISATHRLAFDFEKKERRAGVGAGCLEGNAVHEAFTDVAAKVRPSFAVNTIVNDKGAPVEVFCGDWLASHRAACDFYAEKYTRKIAEKRGLVVVSCGGAPFDLNMIQAHKALETASRICTDGGTIILLAECAEGLGRNDFLKWFEAENSSVLAEKLCADYEVNGQTAWSLLSKTERFDVRIITDLPENETRQMRFHKTRSIDDVLRENDSTGYILPFGAKFLVDLE